MINTKVKRLKLFECSKESVDTISLRKHKVESHLGFIDIYRTVWKYCSHLKKKEQNVTVVNRKLTNTLQEVAKEMR